MNVEEARKIFAELYPNLPLAVKKAVKFTLANWDEMKNIPLAPQPFEFTVAEAKSFLQSLPASKTKLLSRSLTAPSPPCKPT